MSSSKLSERAWRMLEPGEDLKSVHARTQLSIAVLTGMMHDINRQKRAQSAALATTTRHPHHKSNKHSNTGEPTP